MDAFLGLEDADIAAYKDGVIYLNPLKLGNASKEFVITVILHEIVHALIANYTTDPKVFGNANDEQHQVMIDSWIIKMRDAIMDISGMNPNDTTALNDATALAMSGIIQHVVDYAKNKTDLVKMDAKFKEKFGMDLNTANKISDDYYKKANGKGTTCN